TVDEGPAERFGTALALLDGAVVAALSTDNDSPAGVVRLLLFRPDGEAGQSDPTLLLSRDVATVRYVGVAAVGGRLLVGVPAGTADAAAQEGAAYLFEAPPAGR